MISPCIFKFYVEQSYFFGTLSSLNFIKKKKMGFEENIFYLWRNISCVVR